MRCNVSIYERLSVMYAVAMSRTAAGFLVADGEPAIVDSDSTAEEIGRAARTAARRCRTDLPNPTDFRAVTEPLRIAAGVSRYRDFEKSAKNIDVEILPDRILIVPSRNLNRTKGRERGYVPIAEKALDLPTNVTDQELGDAIVTALKNC